MVPEFKKGNYGAGVLSAVNSLGQIARGGPQAAPPGPRATERILDNPIANFRLQHNPIRDKAGSWAIVLMLVAGVACLFAAIWLPGHRKPLIIIGSILIGLAVLFWILIAVARVTQRADCWPVSTAPAGALPNRSPSRVQTPSPSPTNRSCFIQDHEPIQPVGNGSYPTQAVA